MTLDRLGWKKDRRDARDFVHRPRVPFAEVPDVTILSPIPVVRDQGNEGSCVGFGVGGVYTATGMKLLASRAAAVGGGDAAATTVGAFSEWFSPRWIYNGARMIEGTIQEDSGAYPRDAYDFLLKQGGLLEHFWPYVAQQDLRVPPPSKYNVEAAKFPLLSYLRVVDGVENVCAAIAAGHYVSIGCPWYYSWMDVPASGLLPKISAWSPIAGGHETFFYGYDKTKQLLYGQNSWGEEGWGNRGRYAMPFQAFGYFRYGGGYDCHLIDVQWATEPVPPTPPAPGVGRIERLVESVDGGATWTVLYEREIK